MLDECGSEMMDAKKEKKKYLLIENETRKTVHELLGKHKVKCDNCKLLQIVHHRFFLEF